MYHNSIYGLHLAKVGISPHWYPLLFCFWEALWPLQDAPLQQPNEEAFLDWRRFYHMLKGSFTISAFPILAAEAMGLRKTIWSENLFSWSVNLALFGVQSPRQVTACHMWMVFTFTLTSCILLRYWTNLTCLYSTTIPRSSSFFKNLPSSAAPLHRIKANTMFTMFHLTADQSTFTQCSPFCKPKTPWWVCHPLLLSNGEKIDSWILWHGQGAKINGIPGILYPQVVKVSPSIQHPQRQLNITHIHSYGSAFTSPSN